jgi:hypothetical protein
MDLIVDVFLMVDNLFVFYLLFQNQYDLIEYDEYDKIGNVVVLKMMNVENFDYFNLIKYRKIF